MVAQQTFVIAICLYTAELLLREEEVGLDGNHHQLLDLVEVMGVVVDQEMETAVIPQIVQIMEVPLQVVELHAEVVESVLEDWVGMEPQLDLLRSVPLGEVGVDTMAVLVAKVVVVIQAEVEVVPVTVVLFVSERKYMHQHVAATMDSH